MANWGGDARFSGDANSMLRINKGGLACSPFRACAKGQVGWNAAQLQMGKRENEESEGHRLWQIGEATQRFQGMPTACFVKFWGGGMWARCHRALTKMGVHRGADSCSQRLQERSKRRNAARVVRARGSLKLQTLNKQGGCIIFVFYVYTYHSVLHRL